MAIEARDSDLVLAPNEFVLISDSNSGIIRPIVGPVKKTLDNTEQPMVFSKQTKQFMRVTPREAIQLFPVVDERSYLVLENPVPADDPKQYPSKGGDNMVPTLLMGQKKNIPGPTTFPLWPGQIATVIEGHQLRSNQYLRCVVHNAKEAMTNWNKAVVNTTAGQDQAATQTAKLVTGQILIIKGTEVSYYIPPTGINVIPDDKGSYVRDAVTLERLEYCILLDESGDKRYVKGPAVVFPSPTESFIDKNSNRKFEAIELNENMGIYIKVIADYEENEVQFKAGDELFITGKQLKIYYPRAEHAIIKYDDQVRHYAVAIPKGEARYVLNKDTGNIATVEGPLMFLPDPRKEVIVRRILSDSEVMLWFPNNMKAREHNETLRQQQLESRSEEKYLKSSLRSATSQLKRMASPVAAAMMMEESSVYSPTVDYGADDMARKNTFTPPRSITLDSKFDGGVNINVWPGYAVQVVSKNGDRQVIIGPKSVILEYDQTLEVMELSTGKPKTDHNLFKTAYLRIKNNRVSDNVEADTSDMVHIEARVNYRVNFENEPEQWFSVENYVKFLTQNLRSIIRNEIQKHGVQEVSQNATSIIRDVILGVATEQGKERPGHIFPENGMKVYDVEVLSLQIGDEEIREQLTEAQHRTVQNTLHIAEKKQELEVAQQIEMCNQKIEEARSETEIKSLQLKKTEIEEQKNLQQTTKELDTSLAKYDSDIAELRRKIKELDKNLDNTLLEKETAIVINAFKEKFAAISPDLIAALEKSGDMKLAQAFVEHIPQAGSGVGMILGGQLLENLLGMVKGTSMEGVLRNVTKQEVKKNV